jgi:microcystin-dependent protein
MWAAGGGVFAAEVGMVAFFNSSCPENWSAASAIAGRVLVGAGTLSPDTYTLAGTGGAASVTLTAANMPPHVHRMVSSEQPAGATTRTGAAPDSNGGIAPYADGIGGASPLNTLSAGGSGGVATSFDVRQPYYVLTACIRTAEDIPPDHEHDGGGVGFWPEMTMEGAMEIGAAVLLCFALAWGLSVVVRFIINQR